jgi:flagellar basal-body rod protein FlgG
MNNAFYIGATGMQTQQMQVETIANNLANVNTPAFKKSTVHFADLVTQSSRDPISGEERLREAAVGLGVHGISGMRLFEAGELKKTASAFDIAIQGEGMLEVVMADGSLAYTRGGSLKRNADGMLTTQAGNVLRPEIALPDNTQTLSIDGQGRVRVTLAGQTVQTEIGQLELVRFASPGALSQIGDNLYRANQDSGSATAIRAGEEGGGSIVQGMLEGSNVKLVDEMVSLMIAQRAYEASVKAVQAADEMSALINNLRK